MVVLKEAGKVGIDARQQAPFPAGEPGRRLHLCPAVPRHPCCPILTKRLAAQRLQGFDVCAVRPGDDADLPGAHHLDEDRHEARVARLANGRQRFLG